jgi:hypothetical protein
MHLKMQTADKLPHAPRPDTAADALARVLPDVRVPPGLTAEDLIDAARLVAEWQDGDEWSPIPLVVRIYDRLSIANKGCSRSR